MLILSVPLFFDNGTNAQVGAYLHQAEGRYNDLSLAFTTGRSHVTDTTETGTGYIVPCGQFLVYCVGENKFTVTHLLEPTKHHNHGCTADQQAQMSKDIKKFLEDNMLRVLLLTSQHQVAAPQWVAPPPQQALPAPPQQALPLWPQQALPAPPQQVAPVINPQIDVAQQIANALAEERRRVEAERKAEEDRKAHAKQQEEIRLLSERLAASEQANLKNMEQRKVVDYDDQNRYAVARNQPRREEWSFNLTRDQLLVLVVVGLGIYLANDSNKTKMEAMATQTKYELAAISHKYATKEDTDQLNYRIERVQNQPQSTNFKRTDPPSDDEKKKPPPVEQATHYTWTFLAAIFGVVFMAIIYAIAANEQAFL
jgi:hypothetical protein